MKRKPGGLLSKMNLPQDEKIVYLFKNVIGSETGIGRADNLSMATIGPLWMRNLCLGFVADQIV
jgi:hypothetical protein